MTYLCTRIAMTLQSHRKKHFEKKLRKCLAVRNNVFNFAIAFEKKVNKK